MPQIVEIEKYAKTSLKKWLKAIQGDAQLRRRVKSIAGAEWYVDLSICTPVKMAKINQQFRGKNKPTDVLSFPTDAFFQTQGMLGDLVICGSVVVKQAKEVGHTWRKEVDVLVVHGLLHLLGFDHELGPKEEKEMQAWEKKVLGQGLIGR